MIVGIGSDLCDIERIERTLARYGERFIDRCFTETEQRRSDRRATRAASYAKRFAAKEACAKALGTGLRRGVFWRDMGVVNLPSGQPTMKLTGGAAERLRAILPPGNGAGHPPDNYRRGSLRPGVCRHRGPPCPSAAQERASPRVRGSNLNQPGPVSTRRRRSPPAIERLGSTSSVIQKRPNGPRVGDGVLQ